MEPIKEQSATGPASMRSKLRYPLRSASKVRNETSASATMLEIPTSSASRRVRPVSNVSKSVSVIDLSGKDKSAKPPRRLSIPAKSTISPIPKPAASITPISEARAKKSANGQGKSDTPVSNVSRSANRRKFSVLESASYWISQIKLSESASNHLISIGFFKLALESGCEPQKLLRDKLKLYARQHNLLELGEPAKELLRSYNVLEELEQGEASETCSQVRESFDKDSQASSTTESGSLKPKSLNSDNIQRSTSPEVAKKDSAQKRNPAAKNRASFNSRSTSSVAVTENKSNLQRRSQRPSRKEPIKERGIVKKSEKTTASGNCEKDSINPSPTGEIQEEGKENMMFADSLQDAPLVEEISS